MPKNNSAAIIDIGSSKIVGFMANQIEGDDFQLLAQSEVKCTPFYDGKWLDEKEVSAAVISVLKQLENRSGERIKKIYVGVPGEFSAVSTREGKVVFNAPRKITQSNVNEVFENANNFSDIRGFSLISRSSIYFMIDDEKKVVDPVGEVATTLFGLISFIFVEDNFKIMMTKVLKKYGISEFDFVSGNLAQSLYLIEPQVRDNYVVLVDCGFVTTNVSIVLGDGILYSKSFSIGSGQMVDDLSQVLEIDYDKAEKVLQKVHMSLEFDEAGTLEIAGVATNINANKANEIVKCRVEDIAENIIECLKGCPHDFPKNTLVIVTGGAFAYLKGSATYLSKCLDRQVFLAPMNSPQYDKQEYTSAYGLISIALSQSRPVGKGLFRKLLSGFGG